MSAQGPIGREQASTLSEAWSRRHSGVRHTQLRPIPKTVGKPCSPCYFAGHCICRSEKGRKLSEVAYHFSCMAKELLRKGSPPRKLYDMGRLVFRICVPNEACRSSLWLHLGFGNLASGIFTASVLEYHATDADRVILHAVEQNGMLRCHNHWQFMYLKGHAVSWECILHVELWTLDFDSTARVDEFLPQRVVVKRVEQPGVSHLMWRPGQSCLMSNAAHAHAPLPNPPFLKTMSEEPQFYIIRSYLVEPSPGFVPGSKGPGVTASCLPALLLRVVRPWPQAQARLAASPEVRGRQWRASRWRGARPPAAAARAADGLARRPCRGGRGRVCCCFARELGGSRGINAPRRRGVGRRWRG